jgi:hypothetical protein
LDETGSARAASRIKPLADAAPTAGFLAWQASAANPADVLLRTPGPEAAEEVRVIMIVLIALIERWWNRRQEARRRAADSRPRA